jgi:hypothetical protein
MKNNGLWLAGLKPEAGESKSNEAWDPETKSKRAGHRRHRLEPDSRDELQRGTEPGKIPGGAAFTGAETERRRLETEQLSKGKTEIQWQQKKSKQEKTPEARTDIEPGLKDKSPKEIIL